MDQIKATNRDDFPLYLSLQKARNEAKALMNGGDIRAALPIFEDDKLFLKFQRLGPPLASEHVASIIRDTLMLDPGEPLSSACVKEAVLCALLTPLRQSVGSCFATAPCMMVQAEQMENLFHDLFDLITLGRLVRTIDGEEFKAPIALSYGMDVVRRPLGDLGIQMLPVNLALQHLLLEGIEIPSSISPAHSIADVVRMMLGLEEGDEVEDEVVSPLAIRTHQSIKRQAKVKALIEKEQTILRDYNLLFVNPLLKAWEFTVASFTDYKIDAFRWNMAIALGFDPSMKNGVGEVIYTYLEDRLKSSNVELMAAQQELERAQYQLDAAHALLKSATDPDRVRRLKTEAQSQLSQIRTQQELFETLKEDTQKLSQFYNFMVEQYDQLFKLYFQEIYDPDMRDVKESLYEDSPAGFRLVYKYGRAEPSVWKAIRNEKEYIKMLSHFFGAVEPILVNSCEWEKGKDEINILTQRILQFIEEEAFLKSAFKRVKERKELGRNKTPWSYVSGGTLDTLVRCYVKRAEPLTYEAIQPTSVEDLATEMLEVLKGLHDNVLDHPSLLLQTPTHACLLKTQLPLLKEGYFHKGFTYTWMRDHLILPAQNYYHGIKLSRDEQVDCLTEIGDMLGFTVGDVITRSFIEPSSMSIQLFEKKALALFIGPHLTDFIRGYFIDRFDAAPKLFFADSNWSDYYLSFQYNPGSEKLDLFRSTLEGKKSFPMTIWANQFQKDSLPWKIYTRPNEAVLHRFGHDHADKKV